MSTQEQTRLAEATPSGDGRRSPTAAAGQPVAGHAGRVLRQRSARVGLLILRSWSCVAVFAPVIATHDPDQSLARRRAGRRQEASGPCIHLLGCPAAQPEHIFGTDGNFRDVFSRVVYGARMSLTVGFAAVGVRDRHRHGHRRDRGLLGGTQRQRPDAAHGRAAGVPVPCSWRSRS